MKGLRTGLGLILGAIFVLGVSGVPAHAAAIFFDDFNAEHGGVGVTNYSGFTNWNVTNGTVDLIGNGYFDFYPGNGLYVDLDGSNRDAGILTTKTSLSLGPGQYELKFFLGGNHRSAPSDTVNVSVQLGLASATYTLFSSDPLAERTLSFDVASLTSANIVFNHDGGDNIGIILDNVRLIQVPEPGTMVLLGSGLLALVGCGKRRSLKKGGN